MSIGLKITRQIRVFLMAISSTFIAMATALATLNALARRLALGVAWSEELTSYFVVLLVFWPFPTSKARVINFALRPLTWWSRVKPVNAFLITFVVWQQAPPASC